MSCGARASCWPRARAVEQARRTNLMLGSLVGYVILVVNDVCARTKAAGGRACILIFQRIARTHAHSRTLRRASAALGSAAEPCRKSQQLLIMQSKSAKPLYVQNAILRRRGPPTTRPLQFWTSSSNFPCKIDEHHLCCSQSP